MRPYNLSIAIGRDLLRTEGEPRSDGKHLDATIQWLYRSQDVTESDGSAAYYSLLTGWSGPYPETSGYIVPTLYDYSEYADSDEAHRRAERMARWLLELQLDTGAFPGGISPGPNAGPSVFNTGQILLGLIRALRETGDEQFRDAIERAGAWLIEIQHEKGYWARHDYRGEIHSYCSRVAWALLEAYDVTGTDAFSEKAIAHLEWVKSVQTDSDWFEYAGFSPDEVPYLHTIAYTVRGMLEGGLRTNNNRFVSAAKATADRLLEQREGDGPLRGAYDRSWNSPDYYCLTGNAQVALIWLRLYDRYGHQRYLNGAIAEIKFLKTQHLLNRPATIRGAVKGSHPVWRPYMRLRYPNWAAKFFADALIKKRSVDDQC